MITLVVDGDTTAGRFEQTFKTLNDGVLAWERAITKQTTYSATLWVAGKQWRDFDRGLTVN